MSYRRDDEVKLGGTLTAFIGGHVATIRIKAADADEWKGVTDPARSNGEALRRALTAAICWLDGHDALVTPALKGDVTIRPERRRDFGVEP